MILFKDRAEAGKQLGEALKKISLTGPLVVGLPRAGMVVAAAAAQILHTSISIIIPRKIGAPGNPELAIGALAGDEVILDQELIERLSVSKAYLQGEIAEEKREASRREALYRKGRAPENWNGKSVFVIDDGIATGATMRASLRYLKAQGVKRCIAAVPVAPAETVAQFKREGEEILSLYSPEDFFAVGQFYESFPQVEDREVIELLDRYGS